MDPRFREDDKVDLDWLGKPAENRASSQSNRPIIVGNPNWKVTLRSHLKRLYDAVVSMKS